MASNFLGRYTFFHPELRVRKEISNAPLKVCSSENPGFRFFSPPYWFSDWGSTVGWQMPTRQMLSQAPASLSAYVFYHCFWPLRISLTFPHTSNALVFLKITL